LDYSDFDFYSGPAYETVDKSITSQDYKIFLRELRAARRRSGLTQTGLAARLSETQSFVSKCERGERRLDIMELRAFCGAFGVSLPDFSQRLERVLGAAPAKSRRPI
jgi:transcriptional regulator with XRE-family HTH domain